MFKEERAEIKEIFMELMDEIKPDLLSEAAEKTLLLIPDTVGNLMSQHGALAKMNMQFYKDNPDLAKEKDTVVSVMEKVDADNPGIEYDKMIEIALPLIRARISQIKTLDMKGFQRNPNLDISNGAL